MGKRRTVKDRFFHILKEQRGATLVVMVCLFLVLSMMGTELLRTANANTANTSRHTESEQTMLYIASINNVVNELIEKGEFSPGGSLPDVPVALNGFQDKNGNPIHVMVIFEAASSLTASVEICLQQPDGSVDTYTVQNSYQPDGMGYQRQRCLGIQE